jgi:hypothetical protein
MDIKHNEIVLSSMNNEILLILAGFSLDLTEDTPGTL